MKNFIKINQKLRIIAVSTALFALPGLVAAQSWGEQTSSTSADLNSIDFIDDRGFAAGNNGTIVGTDDGIEWNSYSVAPGENLHGISLKVDGGGDYYGFAVGDQGVFLSWNSTQGTNWNDDNILSNENLHGINFLDAETGYVTGENGMVGKTTDGGFGWDDLSGNTGTSETLRDAYFFNETDGFAVGGNGNTVIIETFNGGNNWSNSDHNGTGALNAIHFANDTLGIAVGSDSRILRTTDGGDNWNEELLSALPGFPDDDFTDISSADDTTFYITTEAGNVLVSTDGGNDWEEIDASNNQLNSIVFINPYTSYISGNGGTIMMSCPEASFASLDGDAGCEGDEFTFDNQSQGGVSYTWTVEEDTVSSSEDLTHVFDEAGTFDVTLIAENETCPDEHTMEININSAPVVDLGPDTTIQEGDTYEIDAGPDGESYSWHLNGQSTGFGGQTFEASEAGEYSVAVEDENGCIGRDTVVIDVSTFITNKNDAPEFSLYPNPATDQINISLENAADAEVKIYDLLGQKVKSVQISAIGNKHKIDITEFNEGVYIVEISSGNNKQSRRLIVE